MDEPVKESTIQVKSEAFAARIIRLYRHLCANGKEYDLFRQLLRSGTGIGSNVAEAECAISGKDFLSRMYIALKEASETKYWLRLLKRTGYLSEREFFSIYRDADELFRILSSITKTKSDSLNLRV